MKFAALHGEKYPSFAKACWQTVIKYLDPGDGEREGLIFNSVAIRVKSSMFIERATRECKTRVLRVNPDPLQPSASLRGRQH